MKVNVIELMKHLDQLENFHMRIEAVKYLENFGLEHIFNNFHLVISEEEKTTLPETSHFSASNRAKVMKLKLLNMAHELEKYNNEEP